jgi:Carboxypeptidase regulatory-like domain/TonB-dependent Receptor Plug Domain
MMRARSFCGLLCAALMLACAGSASAQEFRATIKGQVVDTSQAALPGATVTVQNQDTNEVATAVTNNEGAYTVPFLRPGTYTLTVEMSGFQKNTRTNLRLSVGETANINVQLGVGLTETVNVVSETPLLETSKADRGTVIDSARIAELPLQSRSPMALAVLVAGVNYNAQAIYLRPFDNGALADWSMNGGQNRNNEFLLDGAPNNANQGGNNIAYVPPAEAVQEMKIQTNSYDAQYGRTAGGVVNMTLKSGTNSFHGVGYEFMRRKALAANSFLLNSRQAPKTDQYIDQYGFSVDGPIFKNKTFFLFTGEKYREGTPAPQNSTTPTPAMKNGDFSGLVDAQGRQIVIYDPSTGRDVNGVWTRDPFLGNRIPAERISPVARAIMQYYPDPNYTTAGAAPWQNNLDYPEHYNKDLFWNWVGKVDHNFSTNDRAFFRWGENERNEVRNTSAIRSGPAQDGQLPLWRANRAIVGDWVHIFGAGTVFNLRGSYTYFLEWSYSQDSLGFDSTTLGWPSSLVGQMPSKAVNGIFPRIEVEQFVNLSRGSAPNRNRNYTIQPNVSLTRGAHNIRSGLDLRWTNVFNENYNNSGGIVTFNRAFTRSTINSTNALEGNAFASFLLGAPSGGNVDVNPKPHYEWFFVAPWIQDDWRLNDKMTLNLGFRWDFNGSVKEEDNMLNYAFDPTIVNPVSARVGQQVMGGLRFAGVDGAPDRPWKYDKNNYQFRVGTAYQLNEKTVLRAGYGKYFLNPTSQSNNTGFGLSSPIITSTDGNRTPTYALGNPWPSGIQDPPGSSLGPLTFLGRGPTTSNPDFIVPNVHQFSAGIQRELPWRVSLEATYAASRSYDIEGNFGGFNEPSAAFQAACDVTLGGSRSACDQLVNNPFFNVPGFEGTTRFTNQQLSRFELARPFPAFTGFGYNQQNLGQMWYDSMQFVANKRWAKGVTINASYTWVPRWTEDGANTTTGIGNAYVDEVSRLENHGPYFSHRKHRLTASGVYQFPGQNRRDLIGYLLGGWSIAPMLVFQSGQPWEIPTTGTGSNFDLAPGVNLADVALPGKKDGQFIYGVKPCIGQRQANGTYALLSVSQAYGCTEPYFLIREAFQRRTAMVRYDEFRRPSFWQVDVNFAKTTPITDRVRFQVRLEAFNLFNSPMYDERNYNNDTASADFGRINRNITPQSNFQRFIQMGFRLLF